MGRTIRILFGIALIFIISASVSYGADIWPQFRHDAKHTGRSSYSGPPYPVIKKWEFTTGDKVWSSPSIGSDGTIYIGSNDKKLYALNPDGTKKWEFAADGAVHSSPGIGSDGTIYVGSSDKKLYALNPDGTKKWEFITGGSLTSSACIGSDGTIYIGSWDKKVYALNPDGTKKWEFTALGGFYSSPSIGSDGTIYIGSYDKNVYALNPDGTKKWEFVTGSNVYSSPSIGSDETIYIGSYDKKVYALNPDGTKKWEFITGNIVHTTPSLGSDGTIYIGSDDKKVYALNPDSTKKWEFTAGDLIGQLSVGADGTIYVSSNDKKVYALNPDGTKKWEFATGMGLYSLPCVGSDGTIYVGSWDNKIYAITTAPPAAPSGLNAAAASMTQINLSWTDNSSNETGFRIFRNGSLIATAAVNAASYSDTGLTCNTTYNYEVRAVNSGGDSAGVTATATTSACPPTASVSNIIVNNVKTYTAVVGATAAGTGITERGFYWWNTGESSGPIPAGGSGAGAFGMTLTGLKPLTTYNVAAYAKIGSQRFDSVSISFTTAAYAAPTVITEPQSTVNGSDVTVNGEITAVGSLPVNAYGFVYAAHPVPTLSDMTLSIGDPALPLTSGKAFAGTLTGLQPGMYYFRAYAGSSQETVFGEEFSFSVMSTCTGGIPGDLNGDGSVDLTDVIIALKILDSVPVNNLNLKADVNGDCKIGLEEAIFVLQKVGMLR